MRGDDLRYLFHLTRPQLLRAHQACASHRIRYFAFSCSLNNIFRRLWFISQIAESVMIFTLWFFFLFLLRASLGLCEQGCVDLRWVLQRSPEPGQTQLTSPTPDAHAVASHAATGNDSRAGNICFFVGNELSEAEMSSWSSSPCTWSSLTAGSHSAGQCLFAQEKSIDHSCTSDLTELYWFLSRNRKCLFRKGPVSSPSASCSGNQWVTLYRFLFHFTLDGPDVIQQRSKFNMGALSSGPRVCNEWKTQGQPSGQTAVSHYCLKIKTVLFGQCNFFFVDSLIASFFTVWTSMFRFLPTARTNQSL